MTRAKMLAALTSIASICATALLCSAAPSQAQDWASLPPQLLEKVETAQQACTEFQSGTFGLEFGAVKRVDLDGDLQPDWVLDESGFSCSSAASLYCGTGGCMSHFLVGESLASQFNQGWDMTQLGPFRVLLTDVHGSQCGGINPTPCVVASVWDAEAKVWRSTAALWE